MGVPPPHIESLKRPGWEAALADTLEAAKRKAFVWGEHDCCLFAADAVVAMSGWDPAEEFRGRYTSKVGAARVMKRAGAGGVEGIIERGARQRGRPEVSAEYTQRGDIVIVDTEDGPAAGVCAGALTAIVRDGVGLEWVPTLRARRAWRL